MKSNPLCAGRIAGFSVLLILGSLLSIDEASSAVTDLADAPLAGGLNTAKPNIAFVVDDSGSMDDQNMPDDQGTNRSKRCWGWYKYNTLFYNPAYIYKPPFKLGGATYSDGVTRFPDAVFTAALKDGYFPLGGFTYGGDSTSNSATDLSDVENTTSTASSKYYYAVHRTSGSTSEACEDGSNYDVVTRANSIAAPNTTAGSAAAKTNYANWYSYYRRRALLMKVATGEAFKDLDESKYRLGLFFLNSVESGSNGTTRHKNNDLKVADFSGSETGTHRAEWYGKLYGARSDEFTPLRAALSRMGRMYAGQISGWDPVQYSCQQNFTILSTDGFWNTNYEDGSYGPKEIDGTTNVGNTDSPAAVATAARATITYGNFESKCYRATSITVDTGSTAVELLNSHSPSATGCDSRADDFGSNVAASINAKTATTGFSASYSAANNRITINAPLSLGSFTATPVPVFEKANNANGSVTFATTAFDNGGAGAAGAAAPYKDTLNISNTLADVAYYYYTTDLRTSDLGNCSNTIGETSYNELCYNNVLGSGKDVNNAQHMTTFTIGLGVSGTIEYENNYETAQDRPDVTQYYDIVNDSANWPNPDSDARKIDDLWHAAVNGRGTYYSVSDATSLKEGIQSALSGIQTRKGSAAAAATSSLQPVAGDNSIFIALYETGTWDGNLAAYTINPTTAERSSSPVWEAQPQLDAKVAAAKAAGNGDGRSIKFFSEGATNNLKDFSLANLTTDSLVTHFESICSKSPGIGQCGNNSGDLTVAQKLVANSAGNLISYLRGQDIHEDKASNTTVANRVYRGRNHILGDVGNAVPVYVKKPPFSYGKYDETYALFKAANVNRSANVYVAANDGMLHAFDALTGNERWAFVPTAVMSKMYNLADRGYASNHRYFVDGSPTVADICVDLSNRDSQICRRESDWKTILVGGLNKGGCSFYALDVTSPVTPKGLWEFSDPNLGYSFGKPLVVKKSSGRWVVIVSSGYNNYPGNGCGATGDGKGHVFVIDAATGTLLDDIVTTAGSTSAPSGLARLNAWVEDIEAPVAARVYGGDMLGNLWRIDFDDVLPEAPNNNGKEAVLLAQLKDEDNTPQPITVKPVLAKLPTGQALVMVGTGKYLGTNDRSDKSRQSMYAIKDSLGTTGISDVRGSSMVNRTLSFSTVNGRRVAKASGDNVTWDSHDGWYFDLGPANPANGERVNVDMAMQFNLLAFATNIPEDNVCSAGGKGWLYEVDFTTGKALPGAVDGQVGREIPGNALVVGIDIIQMDNGKIKIHCTDSTGNLCTDDATSGGGSVSSGTRRTSWREIPD
ncbi:MAG: hypothetical protein A3I66_05885 [Burkholderiales bacterium RIFCSPLOWO2_02_FULL_57_36]|nr:MAG: hypothetical protein A3I66_05885 [Burkholderiales bacterium RIFCSPLOWO2_02_FULL_57_36]